VLVTTQRHPDASGNYPGACFFGLIISRPGTGGNNTLAGIELQPQQKILHFKALLGVVIIIFTFWVHPFQLPWMNSPQQKSLTEDFQMGKNIYIKKILAMGTLTREYSALISVPHLTLQPYLLNPSLKLASQTKEKVEAGKIRDPLFSYFTEIYNESQISAIEVTNYCIPPKPKGRDII
jgi:hypothetical protein